MSTRRTRIDPDELAALESERDFLLRSLDDLEAERAAGELDDERYETLRDDYTARAAAVLRTLEEGVDARPAPPPVPLRRKLAVGAVLVCFAAAAAFVLAGALGERLPGQTATGNAQSASAADAHLVAARTAMGENKLVDAMREYTAAVKADPDNVEARAYAGWILFISTRSVEDPAEHADRALHQLDLAVETDPAYPDAHFFRGMVLFRGKDDAAGAVPEFERYLALAPEGPQTEQVKAVLEQARAAAGG